jgi:hypothetical protein
MATMDFPDELYPALRSVLEDASAGQNMAQDDFGYTLSFEQTSSLAAITEWAEANKPIGSGDVFAHRDGHRIKVIDIDDGQVAYWRLFPNGTREIDSAPLADFPKWLQFWAMAKEDS